MSDEFLKTLLAAKVPRVHTEEHKKRLKKLLLSQARFSKPQQGKLWERFTLFSGFKNMFLKKWIPATLVAVFVLGLVGQNYKASQNMAYAQSLIDETLEQIKTVSPQSDEGNILLSDLELLQTLQKNGQIVYLGEQISPADPALQSKETRTHFFKFKGENLSSQLVLQFTDQKELSFTFDPPGAWWEGAEIKTDKEGNILNGEELKIKLNDPQLTQSALQALVKTVNLKLLDANKDEWGPEAGKKLYPQLRLLMEEATVPVVGLNTFLSEEGVIGFGLQLFALTGEKERKIEARQQVKKILDWLDQFDTPSAKKKRLLMEKALSSPQINYSEINYSSSAAPLINLSFLYPIANTQEDLNVSFAPDAKNDEGLSFHLGSGTSILSESRRKEVKIWAKDGKLANSKEIQKQLEGTPLDDELLSGLVEDQNQNFLGDFQYLRNAEVTRKMVKELDTIVQTSPLPIQGIFWFNGSGSEGKELPDEDPWSLKSRTNEKGELFIGILYFYSLGEAPKITPDTQAVDKLMEEMRSSTYDEGEGEIISSQERGQKAKIQFLEELKQAKDLKYEGQVTLENGEKAEKVSFTQNGQRMEVIFGGGGSDYEIVE